MDVPGMGSVCEQRVKRNWCLPVSGSLCAGVPIMMTGSGVLTAISCPSGQADRPLTSPVLAD